MDREILFRGQTRKRGEKVRMDGTPVDGNWVYGGIFQGSSDFSIIYGSTDPDNISVSNIEKHVVHTDTVGQYTGLTDKNGVKIFEGDIIKTHYANAKKCDFVERVVFEGGRFCGLYQSGAAKQWAPLPSGTPHIAQDKSVYMDWCEVIGNIHDNPELIGGEDDG